MKPNNFQLTIYSPLLLLIFFVSLTPAQTSYLDSLDGKFALQFQINENFRLSDFQGTTFSGKYHLGKKEAIRLGISLGFVDQQGDMEQIYFDNDSTLQSDFNQNHFMIGIRIQYIRYFMNTNDICFYGGTGPVLTYENTEQTEFRYPPVDYEIEHLANVFSVGFNLLAGVEWIFTENMSLSAEYGILFSYNNVEQTYTRPSPTEPKKSRVNSDSFSINADHINFGISVYF